jgi:hypothetical protein
LYQGVQTKLVNLASVGANPTSGSFIDFTSTVSIGTTELTRIGNRIRVKRIELRFFLLTSNASNMFRLLIFKWRPDTSSDPPALSEILTDTGSNTRQTLSPFLVQNPSRFKILMDWTVALDTYHPMKHHSIFLDCDDELSFTANNVQTGQNHFYMCYMSDSTVTGPAFTYESIVHFTDL